MKMKFSLLFLLLVFSFTAAAQVPNCQINFGPWTDTNQSPPSFNGITQCAYWVITYQVTGFSAISLQFDSATGTNAGPGAFGAFSGTVVTGVNPNTSVACATPTNCTTVFSGVPGWFRVSFPTHAGSGTIQGTLQGYKSGVVLGGNQPASASGCPGTVGTPCVVDGPTAAGVAPTTPPVLQAGIDGTLIRTIVTDTAGRQVAVGGAAPGAVPAGNPVEVAGFDGTNVQPLSTDTSGRQRVIGTAASGAAAIGPPVEISGVSSAGNAVNLNVGTAGALAPETVAATLADAVNNAVNRPLGTDTTTGNHGSLQITNFPFGFNGTAWDRARQVSLVNMPTAVTTTGVSKLGVSLSEKSSHIAAAGAQTVTIAAEAGVRHVLDCIAWSAAAAGAVTATAVNLNVRDGATGAGTILWTFAIAVPTGALGAQTVPVNSICGLNLAGTTNTAMTVEFSSAPTNLAETVNASFFNVN